MKIKKLICFLMMLHWFSAIAITIQEEQSEGGGELDKISPYQNLPEEITLLVLGCTSLGKTIAENVKQIADLRLIDKRHANLCLDASLIRRFLILSVRDSDYESILNKLLFKAAALNKYTVLQALSEMPNVAQAKLVDSVSNGENLVLDVEEYVNEDQKYFLEANVNNIDVLGYTPLLYASARGHKESVLELLKGGALIITENEDGDTALILASKHGYLNIVESFLQKDTTANFLNMKDCAGNTAFLSAAKGFLYAGESEKQANYLAILKLLVAHNVDVNAFDAANLSAMDWASKEGKIELIGVLLDLKCHLSKQNKIKINICLFALPSNEETQKLLEKIKFLEEDSEKIKKMKFQFKDDPYWLSFKIGTEFYKIEIENESINVEFSDSISKLNDEMCHKIGTKMVEKIYKMGTLPNSIVKNSSYVSNDYGIAFKIIFGELFSEASYAAENSQNFIAIKKIKEIVRLIFKAYPEKGDLAYRHFITVYDLNNCFNIEIK